MSEKRCLIPITELRAIGSDRYTWSVMKRTKKTDKAGNPAGGYSEWVAYKWPLTFQACAVYIEEESIRTSGSTTLTELYRVSERLHGISLDTLDAATLAGIAVDKPPRGK